MIQISDHAKKRIWERFKRPQLFDEASRAFESKEKIPIWFAKKDLTKMGFTTYLYRALIGNVYVFRKEEDNFILLTVYKTYGDKRIFKKQKV